MKKHDLLAMLEAIVTSWDEPYYGASAMDDMSRKIEQARAILASAKLSKKEQTPCS